MRQAADPHLASSPTTALRRAAAVALAMLAIATLLGAPGFATGAGAQPGPTTTVPTSTSSTTTTTRPGPPSVDPNGPLRLDLVDQTPFVPATGGQLDLRLRVGGKVPDGAELAVEVVRFSGVSNVPDRRDRLDRWADGETNGVRTTATEPVPLAELPEEPGGTRLLSLNLQRDGSPAGTRSLRISDAGVFPLVVRLVRLDDPTATMPSLVTFLIQVPDVRDRPALRVATVVPLRSAVTVHPDGARRFAEGDARRLDRVRRLLESHPDLPLTVDALGETVDALGQTGAGSPAPTAAAMAAAIGGREVSAPAWVDLDLDGWAGSPLASAFERQRVLPTYAVATHLRPPAPLETGTWLTTEGITAEARALLRDSGIERLVVPDRDVAPVDGRVGRNRAADDALRPFAIDGPGDSIRALTADRRLTDRLTATPNPVVNAQLALADLVLLACGGPDYCTGVPTVDRSIVLRAPEDERGLDALDRLLTLLGQPGGRALLRPTTLTDAFAIADAEDPDERGRPLVRPYVAEAGEVPDLDEFARRLAGTNGGLDGFRSMVLDTGPASADALQQRVDVAGGRRTPGGWSDYLDAVDVRVREAVDGITVPGQEVINLTANDAFVEVRLESTLDFPVTVDLELEADRPIFEDGRTTTRSVRLDPEQAGIPVRVPVQTESSGSGLFTIDVRVLSPDGHLTLGTTRLQVRSAVFSGVGLVLTIGAFVFLLTWWGRHFRDARRSRKLVPADEVAEATALATGEHRAVVAADLRHGQDGDRTPDAGPVPRR